MRRNYKPLIIGILCILIVFMAIGFALLSQELTIAGTSSINSNWNIRITNIRVKNVVSAYATGDNASADVSETTGCTTKTAPCNSTSANFEARLITPGDSITYEVTITNSGTLDGVVESINLTCSEYTVKCTKTGLLRGDTIAKNNGTNTVDIKIEYDSETSSQPLLNLNYIIKLAINYQQDLGQVVACDYVIGDTITYKDTMWRVIKNSPISESYVTLLKTNILTNAELGTYAYGPEYDSMEFTWTSTCHNANHGYGATTSRQNCNNTNGYETSKVKEAVDAYAIRKGMMSELAEVEGYKIRLLKYSELDNLGYKMQQQCTGNCWEYYGPSENTPIWVYSNVGEVFEYWTMTPYDNNTSSVRTITTVFQGSLGNCPVYSNIGVRPVINLLKSAIPDQT